MLFTEYSGNHQKIVIQLSQIAGNINMFFFSSFFSPSTFSRVHLSRVRGNFFRRRFHGACKDVYKRQYANILMPIINNIAYIQYALVAIAGSVMAVGGMIGIGSIASFLQCTRSFSMPITQMSQQVNSILMALSLIHI